MLRRLGSRIADKRGVAALEFVLVAPVMIIIMYGLYEGAQMVRAAMMLSNAAAAIADLAAQQINGVTSGTSGSLGNFCKAGMLVMTPFPTNGTSGNANAFSVAIASVTNYTSGGVKEDWESDLSCTVAATAMGSGAVTDATTPTNLVPNAGAPGDSVIVVQATYIYSSAIQYVLPGLFTFSQTSFARPRGNSPISCTSPCT